MGIVRMSMIVIVVAGIAAWFLRVDALHVATELPGAAAVRTDPVTATPGPPIVVRVLDPADIADQGACDSERTPTARQFQRWIQVEGRVHRSGERWADCNLEFVSLAGSVRCEDWDFTDAQGCYSVRLRPGSYWVRTGGPLGHELRVVVPGREPNFLLDLHY